MGARRQFVDEQSILCGQEEFNTEHANNIQLGKNGMSNFDSTGHGAGGDARWPQREIEDMVGMTVLDHTVVDKAAINPAGGHDGDFFLKGDKGL